MFRFILIGFLIGLAWPSSDAAAAKPICGATTSSKDIQLLTPNNPPRECVYHIKAYSSYVCQLRIDFAMNLAQPTIVTGVNGLQQAKCQNDYFNVAGLHLCGTETQQHVYVPFNRTAGVTTIDLSIVLAGRVGWTDLPTPSWDMDVRQLECPAGASVRSLSEVSSIAPEARATIKDGFFVAPPGCLQYFPQAFGAFTSFNFNNGVGLYPGNLNYAICFRRTEETKSLDLKAHFFQLGFGVSNPSNLSLDNYCYPQLRTQGVNEDFLMIPQATLENGQIRATYFCGDIASNANIRSTHPGPLMMIFNSDGIYKRPETGFVFSYKVV